MNSYSSVKTTKVPGVYHAKRGRGEPYCCCSVVEQNGRGMEYGAEIQWHALMQVTFACCIVHSNGGSAGPDPP